MTEPINSSAIHLSTETLVIYPRNHTEGLGYLDPGTIVPLMPYTNIKELLARFFLTVNYEYYKVNNWREKCIGISSNLAGNLIDTPLNTHMPMFDYDGKHIKTLIRKDVKLLQDEYGLGPAHVFRTKGGFHVIFMCDQVNIDQYITMLNRVKCCKGFRKAVQKNYYGVLRISAKYTEFDIQLEYVLEPKVKDRVWRKHRKGHLIEAFYRLGQESGTHFASLFPDWALFKEDSKPWKNKPNPRLKKGEEVAKKLIKQIESLEQIDTGTVESLDAWTKIGHEIGKEVFDDFESYYGKKHASPEAVEEPPQVKTKIEPIQHFEIPGYLKTGLGIKKAAILEKEVKLENKYLKKKEKAQKDPTHYIDKYGYKAFADIGSGSLTSFDTVTTYNTTTTNSTTSTFDEWWNKKVEQKT